jgi:hypothetical protein
MIKVASFVAAIFTIMAGLVLWKTYGPVIFFDILTIYNMC